ncbi:cytochrome c biogenesis CcdA family protein [Caproicibacter fermentans]|uniref:cytochrome c biogenesis CcdA family protein n=1 Tax=Caproicibacter fermentans TaxID=2576756 RepID=UPI000827E243|nr:cytochrome C biogenesis protein ResB [Clostridium sp. W14A]
MERREGKKTEYLITFLEGVVTFVSPCLLPMLPAYASFFAGQEISGGNRGAVKNALGFTAGFTVVFLVLGAFAGTLGAAVRQHSRLAGLFAGAVMVLFGLHFAGVLHIGFLEKSRVSGYRPNRLGFFRCALFGAAFSVGWTPCVGAFLGSALMLAAAGGESWKGILLLLAYSAGLGIPFVASALLIDRLKRSFDRIKRHYRAVTAASGILLVIVGVLTAAGLLVPLS